MQNVGGSSDAGERDDESGNPESPPAASQQLRPNQASAPHAAVGGNANKPPRRYFRELLNEGPDRHIELLLTIAIATFSCFQLLITCSNNSSTSQQSQRLLDAANRADDAADSFAASSAHINDAMISAVHTLDAQAIAAGQLGIAANKIGQSADSFSSSSRSQARSTQDLASFARQEHEAEIVLNRPLITMKDLKTDEQPVPWGTRRSPLVISFTLQNFGHFTAQSIQYKFAPGTYSVRENPKARVDGVISNSLGWRQIPDLPQTASVPIEIDYSIDNALDDGVPFLAGRIEYTDTMQDHIWRNFCIEFMPIVHPGNTLTHRPGLCPYGQESGVEEQGKK